MPGIRPDEEIELDRRMRWPLSGNGSHPVMFSRAIPALAVRRGYPPFQLWGERRGSNSPEIGSQPTAITR